MPWEHKGGAEVQLHSFLMSSLDGGQWSTSCTWPLYPQGQNSWYTLHKTARLDVLLRHNFVPVGIWTPGCPACSPVSIWAMLSWLPLLLWWNMNLTEHHNWGVQTSPSYSGGPIFVSQLTNWLSWLRSFMIIFVSPPNVTLPPPPPSHTHTDSSCHRKVYLHY